MSKLNPEQQQAVEHFTGPCVVVAVPGSGKTMTLTARVVNLINNKGVSPKNLLCLTFTNKAAGEMRERSAKALGQQSSEIWFGTFHSICLAILRRYGKYVGLNEGFSVYSEKDQKELITKIARMHELECPPYRISELARAVNDFREEIADFEEAVSEFPETEKAVMREYMKSLDEFNAVDFSGILYKTWNLFLKKPESSQALHNRFQFVMIDETQDTNTIQYEIVRQIVDPSQSRKGNLFAVGDFQQCVREGQFVDTPSGSRVVDSIDIGDHVLSARGDGSVTTARVVAKQRSDGLRMETKIVTKRGKQLLVTNNHNMFVERGIWNPDKGYFVYLMRRRDQYRIGTSRFYNQHKTDGVRNGFSLRCAAEGADAGWIIEYCDSEKESRLREKFYAYSFGIPTDVFRCRSSSGMFSQDDVDRIHASVDSKKGAGLLAAAISLDLTSPQWNKDDSRSKAFNGMTITVLGDARHGILHRYAVRCSDQTLIESISREVGLKFSSSHCDVRYTQRADGCSDNLHKLMQMKSKILDIAFRLNVPFVFRKKIKIQPGKSLDVVAAGSLVPGDRVPILLSNGHIELDEVVEVSTYPSKAAYYDFEIEGTHNFITGQIVHSNSIFGWRGAKPENIMRIFDDFDDAKKIVLPRNYRSTPQVLAAAEKLIRYNSDAQDVTLMPTRDNGSGIVIQQHPQPEEESRRVVMSILDMKRRMGYSYKDFAILYRTNELSKVPEMWLRRYEIPYRIVGGFSFFDRREIKLAVAYLSFLTNPMDTVSFSKIIENPKRGIGKTIVGRMERFCLDNRINMLETCRRMKEVKGSTLVSQSAAGKFASTVEYWREQEKRGESLAKVVAGLLHDMKFLEYVEKEMPKDEAEGSRRINNVEELLVGISDFEQQRPGSSLIDYLHTVQLMSSLDQSQDDDAVTLLTMHSAKGLEFPVVYIIGCEEGIVPHYMALRDRGIDEERRLMYVAMTRAKDHLVINHCRSRKRFDRSSMSHSMAPQKPSSFLFEIQE